MMSWGNFEAKLANPHENQNLFYGNNYSGNLKSSGKEKIRIAVIDFDFTSLSKPNLPSIVLDGARGMSNILVDQLVKNGNFIVIERSRVDAVLAEQNIGSSQTIDVTTAAQIGKTLGVEMVLLGAATRFDLSEQEDRYKITVPKIPLGENLQEVLGEVEYVKNTTEANVQLNVRLVNTSTSEVIFVAEGHGTDSQSNTRVSGGPFTTGPTTNNQAKLLATAAKEAVSEIVRKLDSESTNLAALRPLPNVYADVADVTEGSVILNKGISDGYRVGMKLSIERVTRQVKDPKTGKVIRNITKPVGTVELLDVDSISSIGKITEITRGEKLQVGDIAKPIQ